MTTADRIVVTDLGSEPGTLERVRRICATYDAALVVHPAEEWSRSLALNVAVRHAGDVRYVVTTDVDTLFSDSWLSVATKHAHPRRYLITQSRDLPEGWIVPDRITAEQLKRDAALHPLVGMGAASVIPAEWFYHVRGYDEKFRVWSCEDNCLAARADWDGLEVAVLPPQHAVVAHQYHDRTWATDAQWEIIRANRAYLAERFKERGPVIRNPDGWGGVKG